jgi:hypothetical protein
MTMQPGQAPNPQRPGQMTAVMRAMAQATGPKVLRIGVVQSGRVLEERIIKQRTSVTVGQSEKAMFVVPSQAVPPQFKLFELIAGEYYLNFVDGMSGRVALASGITDITALKGQAKKVGNNVYQVKLTDEARGKVVLGDLTFLFQFVAPPPVQPKPQLPLAVKGGLASQIDWTLTIIAAFSFLLHFGVIGAMYSDWMDPVVDESLSIQALVDLQKNVPPPEVEQKPDDTATPTPTASAVATAAPSKSAPSSGQASAKAGGAVSDAKAAALSAQADKMEMQMLAAFGGGSAVQGALNRSDIPPVDLSGAAASNTGVSSTGGGLNLGSGGAPVQGGRGGGLAGVTAGNGASAQAGAGAGRDVGGPKGDVSVGSSSASVPVSGADRVIAGLRPGFRACYNTGLQSDPTMSGKVTISVKIGPNGEVSSADVASNSGLSDGVANCIARKLRNAQFDAPGGGGSVMQVPVTFVQQAK